MLAARIDAHRPAREEIAAQRRAAERSLADAALGAPVATDWSKAPPRQCGHPVGQRQRDGAAADDVAMPGAFGVFIQKPLQMPCVAGRGALGPLDFDGAESTAAGDDEIHFRGRLKRQFRCSVAL